MENDTGLFVDTQTNKTLEYVPVSHGCSFASYGPSYDVDFARCGPKPII